MAEKPGATDLDWSGAIGLFPNSSFIILPSTFPASKWGERPREPGLGLEPNRSILPGLDLTGCDWVGPAASDAEAPNSHPKVRKPVPRFPI